MAALSQQIQTADWQTEKHVPVIECPTEAKAGELFDVEVTLGAAVAHPNTTDHHISWIMLYYQPQGAKFIIHIATFEFMAHGASTEGANQGSTYTHHRGVASMKTDHSGTLHALAYCNIHGLWQSSRDLNVR